MKWLIWLSLFLSLSLFAGSQFSCPMHCEGAKTYEKVGTCPICHMDLVEKSEEESTPLNSREFRVDMTTNPAEAVTGKPVTFELEIFFTKNESHVREFDAGLGNEVEVHLVKRDGTWYRRFLPTATNEKYVFENAFTDPGFYTAFVVFTPKKNSQQIIPLSYKVKGSKLDSPVTLNWEVKPKTKLLAQHGKRSTFTFEVSAKSKTPKSTLREKARWFIMSSDTTKVALGETSIKETSPLTATLSPELRFSKPGKYSLFLELWDDKRSKTFEITVD